MRFRACQLRAQEATVEGQTVAEVRVVDQSGKPVTEKIPRFRWRRGKPFDFADERESLRELYATGDYARYPCDGHCRAGGAARSISWFERNFYNNVIRIEGLKEPPTEPAALAALRLNLGEPFRESALREAVARLKSALSDDGLYQAKINWTLEPHEIRGRWT